jgi:hypothetical protein
MLDAAGSRPGWSRRLDLRAPAFRTPCSPLCLAAPLAMSSLSTRIRLAPIVAAMVYLNGTVVLLASGIWPWPLSDPAEVYGYLLLANGCLLLGYLGAAFRAPREYDERLSPRAIFWACAITSLILLLPTIKARTGSWLPDVVEGVTHPGQAYARALAGSSQTSWVEYVRIVLGVPLTLLLPLTVYDWPRLTGRMRLTAAVALAGYAAIYVAIGTNKGLADTVIEIAVVAGAAALAGRARLSRRRALALAAAGAVVVAGFLAFFTAGQFDRRGGLAAGLAIELNHVDWRSPARPPEERYAALVARGAAYGAGSNPASPPTLVVADRGNPLLRPLPGKLARGAIALAGYLTQGYYGMSLAMAQPWVPTYGLGSSYFIVRNASRVLRSPAFEDRPYPMRVETHDGWDAWGHWSAWYAWTASDVSFPGTLLILLLLGRLLALSWLDTLEGSNPFAVGVFALGMLIVAYMPANNQVFADGETAVGAVGLLGLWLLTRRRPVPGIRLGSASRAASRSFERRRRQARRRRTLAACLVGLVAGAPVGVWLRPRGAPATRGARAILVLAHRDGESALYASLNARLLASLASLPELDAEARSALPAGLRARAAEVRVTAAPTPARNVEIDVTGPSAPVARAVAERVASALRQITSIGADRGGAAVLPLGRFGHGAYSAAPRRLAVVGNGPRGMPALRVACGPVVGCGTGIAITFPFAPAGYRATAEVRSPTPGGARLLLALGHGRTVSTSKPVSVGSRWRRLTVAWVPPAGLVSMSLDVQSAARAASAFEVADVALQRVPRALFGRLPLARVDLLLAQLRGARIATGEVSIPGGSSPSWPWALVGMLVGASIALAAARGGVRRGI